MCRSLFLREARLNKRYWLPKYFIRKKKKEHLTRKGDEVYTEGKDDVLLKLLECRSLKLQPATFRDASTGAFAVKPLEAQ